MKKIVIFDTALGTSNVGDEIILDSIEQSMDYLFDNNFAVRLATHVNNFSNLQMLRNAPKVRFFKNADLKFVCGTNLISQKRIGKVNSQWQLKMSNLPIYKDCILVGAGATTGDTKLDFLARCLYRNVLSSKYTHSVRDEQSKQLIESLGLRAINTGCPTLWKLTPDHCRQIPKKKGQKCILSVSGYKEQRDAVNDQLMIDVLKANYPDLTAWIQTTEDEAYLSALHGTEKIKRIYSLRQYQKTLCEGDVDYVGTRLHGGVFALQNYRRSIIISIDHRAEGFHESNNLPIVRRREISSHLDNIINSSWPTEIEIDLEAIEKFKGQFI